MLDESDKYFEYFSSSETIPQNKCKQMHPQKSHHFHPHLQNAKEKVRMQ